jgi:imidazole glycerol-phosphate synthase subunit HisH
MELEIVVAATGTANIASVMAGLRRSGARPRLAETAAEVLEAPAAVLPGVGAMGAAMEKLVSDGMVPVLKERFERGLPTLAVCLGLQLLADNSEESPGVSGLRVFRGLSTRFPESVTVPQMGWNMVEPDESCQLLEPGYAYFANSFRLESAPAGWSAAWSDHGGPFVAAVERGPLLACQFHPELSSEFGQALLTRWVDRARQGGE